MTAETQAVSRGKCEECGRKGKSPRRVARHPLAPILPPLVVDLRSDGREVCEPCLMGEERKLQHFDEKLEQEAGS